MYHGTWNSDFDLSALDDICLAWDREVSEAYNATNIVEIEVSSDAVIATESEFLAVLEEAGHDIHPGWFFETADSASARAIVAAAGYDGVRYDDATEDNSVEHETVRVWNMATLTVLD